jgi:hypothetical protein
MKFRMKSERSNKMMRSARPKVTSHTWGKIGLQGTFNKMSDVHKRCSVVLSDSKSCKIDQENRTSFQYAKHVEVVCVCILFV